MKKTETKTIVFITGLFVSNSCWDDWILFFESKGYTCLAPSHPHKNVSAETLRSRHPNEKVASLTLKRLTDFYADFVKKLPEIPVLIGHSVGGLIVQILLQQNLGAAGIAIHPVPPKGIVPFRWSSFKTVWGAMGLFTPSRQTFLMSLEQWRRTFTNGMTLQEQRRSYYQYVIPESKKIPRDVMTKAASIDFSQPHAPLLIMSGSSDKLIPATTNHRIYRKYKGSHSITDYKEFKGRNHFVLVQPFWKENAEYILHWLNE